MSYLSRQRSKWLYFQVQKKDSNNSGLYKTEKHIKDKENSRNRNRRREANSNGTKLAIPILGTNASNKYQLMERRVANNKQGVVLLTARRLPGKLQAATRAAPHPGFPVCLATYTEGANVVILRIISLAL